MVSIKLIKSYDFKTIEEYFQYIIDSKINGQLKQVSELVAKLSKQQLMSFYMYCKETSQTEYYHLIVFIFPK